ncbi:enoyl-CoA hydratase-related protein [Flavobacteriales bacterium]|nr:enoyl-CoA hydratase-related protein [Flavobacteriales bacterium]
MKTINYKENNKCKVGIIEINRPSQLNALNNLVIDELNNLLIRIELSKKIRSIIITGSGEKAFVAGADIKEFKNYNNKQAQALSKQGKIKLFDKITNFKMPVISAINGYALGGGLELALASHIRIACKSAKLGLPECSLGLIPGYSGTQKLTRIIGLNRAMEMILTAKIISAEEALSMGILNRVVTQENLLSTCLDLASMFNKISRESATAAIKCINVSCLPIGEKIETEEFGKLFETEGFKEGVAAFLEKRKPIFK